MIPFYYDETLSSCLGWAEDRYSGQYRSVKIAEKGTMAGAINLAGYWQVYVRGSLHLGHRVIWELHYGPIPEGMEVDHKNGIRSDNRLDNLRLVTRQQNMQNTTLRSDSTTGVVGVCYSASGYPCYIANWAEDGKRKCKKFSIRKHGEGVAFHLACEYRQKMVEKLNAAGQNYTERHGTE